MTLLAPHNRSRAGRVAGLLCALVFVAVLGAAPARAATATFNYTGGQQIFVVPAGVTSIHVVAVGGKGGAGPAAAPSSDGGFGAVVTADLAVTPGEVLYVVVGGNGSNFNSCCAAAFNGGGAGGAENAAAGGGGGASDVRRRTGPGPPTLASRLLVAAGGGGGSVPGGAAGASGGTCAGCGGAGGAGSAGSGGSGGSGSAPGGDGQLGAGGAGGSSTGVLGAAGGGGGGGLYGGGGGGGSALGGGGGGGGGSSLVPAGGTGTLDSGGVPFVTISFTDPPSYPLPPGSSQTPPRATPTPGSPLELMSPFPVVRLSGRVTARGARIRLLTVRAPSSATIRVRCRGRRCPRRQTKRGRGINRPVRFRRFERSLRARTILEVRVTRPGVIGKFTRFRIRRGRPPARRDLCLRPGASTGSRCPDS